MKQQEREAVERRKAERIAAAQAKEAAAQMKREEKAAKREAKELEKQEKAANRSKGKSRAADAADGSDRSRSMSLMDGLNNGIPATLAEALVNGGVNAMSANGFGKRADAVTEIHDLTAPLPLPHSPNRAL
jgi:hypothetical protein